MGNVGKIIEFGRSRSLNLRKYVVAMVALIAVVVFSHRTAHSEDLVDLLHAGKIEVEITGTNIASLSIKIRPAVPLAASINIPVDVAAGTFFAAGSSSVQNMIATSTRSVMLTGSKWVLLRMRAACANRPRRIPESDDHFTAERLENGAELAIAAQALSAAKASEAVTQAGVWIISDNASYDDLGTLVQSGPETLPSGVVIYHSGDRVIREDDAARALKILNEAGIDILKKQIMADRDGIAAGMRDSSLKIWLASLKVGQQNRLPSVVKRDIQQQRRDSSMQDLRLAMQKQEKGDWDGAISEYRARLSFDFDHVLPLALVHQALGNALRAKGDFLAAAAEYRSAIQLEPAHGATHRQLGMALQALGDLSGAIQEYKRAVELQPDDLAANERLKSAMAPQEPQ